MIVMYVLIYSDVNYIEFNIKCYASSLLLVVVLWTQSCGVKLKLKKTNT